METSESKPTEDASKMCERDQNRGASLPWEKSGGCRLTAPMVSGVKEA
jgi:hypothetical protein